MKRVGVREVLRAVVDNDDETYVRWEQLLVAEQVTAAADLANKLARDERMRHSLLETLQRMHPERRYFLIPTDAES